MTETKKTSLEVFTVEVDHVGPWVVPGAIVRLFRVNSANYEETLSLLVLLLLAAGGASLDVGSAGAGASAAVLAVLLIEGDALLVGSVGAVLLIHDCRNELSVIEAPSLGGVLAVIIILYI